MIAHYSTSTPTLSRRCRVAGAALALWCTALATPPAQVADPGSPVDADSAVSDTAALAAFERLGFRQKAAVLRSIERQLAASTDPVVQRIVRLRGETAELPDAPEHPPIFDPKTYAPGLAPERQVVHAGQPRHDAVRARFPTIPFLPDLHREVLYDWCRGIVVRSRAPLDYGELFENFLHGYPPGSDHALANILARLDVGADLRRLGFWFGHGYADLDARTYEDVSLYEVWYSGKLVDVPDVDALPFAWDIAGKKSLRSPLSGRPRDLLYEDIKQGASRYRKHRTLCEAAAAAFVRAEPQMDPMYARLVPRFHYLFATEEDSIDKVAATILAEDRDALLESIDDKIREPSGAAYEVREGRKRELEASALLLRRLALSALERIGGKPSGGD